MSHFPELLSGDTSSVHETQMLSLARHIPDRGQDTFSFINQMSEKYDNSQKVGQGHYFDRKRS